MGPQRANWPPLRSLLLLPRRTGVVRRPLLYKIGPLTDSLPQLLLQLPLQLPLLLLLQQLPQLQVYQHLLLLLSRLPMTGPLRLRPVTGQHSLQGMQTPGAGLASGEVVLLPHVVTCPVISADHLMVGAKK